LLSEVFDKNFLSDVFCRVFASAAIFSVADTVVFLELGVALRTGEVDGHRHEINERGDFVHKIFETLEHAHRPGVA